MTVFDRVVAVLLSAGWSITWFRMLCLFIHSMQ